MTTQDAINEAGIRQQIDKLVETIRANDLAGVKPPIYAADIVSFDAGPPLQCVGAERKWQNWEQGATLFEGPLGFEMRDLTITAAGDVGFAHSFNRVSGMLKNGNEFGDFWVRATYCFRKIDGKWLIAHDHASVPIDFASGTALLNLEP